MAKVEEWSDEEKKLAAANQKKKKGTSQLLDVSAKC